MPASAHDMCTRRLTRELQSLLKTPLTNPKIRAVPNESNILEWHYVIEGSKGTPYENGHYHGKLLFPKEYPLKPPSVIMLTPSGRFKPNRRLCLSMSDFHPESWNPMWSVSTILTGLYSFMIETGPTLGSMESTDRQKRKLARGSLEFNVKDGNFCKLFPDLVDLHKEQVLLRRILLQQQQKQSNNGKSLVSSSKTSVDKAAGGGAGGGGFMDGDEEVLLAAAAGVVAVLSLLFALRFF